MRTLEKNRIISSNISDGASKLAFYFDLEQEILKESHAKFHEAH